MHWGFFRVNSHVPVCLVWWEPQLIRIPRPLTHEPETHTHTSTEQYWLVQESICTPTDTSWTHTNTQTQIPLVPLRFVYSKYLMAGLAPAMLSIINDQRMGELELLLTLNHRSVKTPAGPKFVLTSAASMLQDGFMSQSLWYQLGSSCVKMYATCF